MSYTFGEFELDPASYELRSRGQSLVLQPKVLELISYLVLHRDRVIGKHELLSALWPDVTVSESSLAWCVSQARKALGQKRGDRDPIETVHGRGYRFGTPVHAAAPPIARAPSPAPGPRTGSPGRSGPVAFVGRQHAMSSLRQALDRTRLDRRGNGYVLVGEAGIGKTRCAEELVVEARAAGMTAWVGRCLRAEGTPALWPWIQILRERLRARGDDATREAAEGLLVDLVPRDSAALDPAFTNGRSNAFWLLDRLATFLTRCAEGTPLLVVMDDLQWADLQSIRALELLAPDLERHAILLVATLRDTDEPSEPSTRPLIERLGRHFTNVPLSGFRPGEVEEYLTAATGRTPSAERVTEVHQKTGGNPLFVQEMAQRLIELASDGAGDLGEVTGARGLVLARLERRDPSILRALEAASVLGESFDLPVLAGMLNLSGETLGPILDAAVQARLIERRSGAVRYGFVHALIRLAIHAGLSETARGAWHRLAGEVLESRAVDDETLTQLAFHFYEALRSGTHAKAARYAAAAAQGAARIFAHEEAQAHWEHALEALDFHALPPDSDADMRCRVLVGLASTERQLGLRDESRGRLKHAIRIARDHRNPGMLLAAARVLRHSLLSHIDIDPLARDAIESALPMLGDDRERATALTLLGAVHLGSPASAQSREASHRALELTRAADGQARLEALWSRTFSLSGPDDVVEVLDVSREMLELDASLGRSWWSGEAHYAAFCAHSYRGDVRERDRALDEIGRLARYCRLPEALWHHDRLRAQLSFQAGDFTEAEASWRELSERGVLAKLNYVKILYAMHRLALDIERGAAPATGSEFSRILSFWSSSPRARALRMVSLIEAGRPDEARTDFEEMAARGFESLPRDRSILACLATLATVAIALDDRARAAELEALLVPYASFNTPDLLASSLGSAAHYLGLLAHYLGNDKVARERFDLALVRNVEMGLRPSLARTELAFAKVLALTPATRRRAAALAASAAASAKEFGMARVESEARAFARTLA